MHWPTMAERPNRQAITSLPGVQNGVLVILADSARFHYQPIRDEAPNCIVVWRALPRVDMRPALLGWDPEAVADECLNLFDEQPHGGTEWFTPLNELQFKVESGEDFPGFGVTAERLGRLRPALRQRFSDRGLDVRLIFPAWGPDQPDGVDSPFRAADEWLGEAMAWDAIGMHVYSHTDGDPEHRGARNVTRTHQVMRRLLTDRFGDTGRTKPLIYTEMNANRDPGVDDRDMLIAAAQVCASDPHCLGYAYYIWETEREGETGFSVFGNDARMALFQDPPTIEPVQPVPPPTDVLAVRRELRRIADNTDLTPGEMRQQLQNLIELIEV
jgi:hypothetical protein